MTFTLGTELELPAIEAPMVAALHEQRSRFEKQFAGFSDADWHAPTRCTAWDVQQVLIHICGANVACVRVLRGQDETVGENFNPNRSPGLYVDSRAGEPTAATLDHLASSSGELFEAVARVAPRVVYCTHGPESFVDRLRDAGHDARVLGRRSQGRLF